jgi:hypothetical protein
MGSINVRGFRSTAESLFFRLTSYVYLSKLGITNIKEGSL